LDVHRLWAGLKSEVKNPQIRIYESYAELKKAAEGDMSNPESSGDTELKGLCRLVEKYRHRLPGLIQQIIKNSTGPTQADIQLVTAHRAKGLEWPHVKLANDFTPLLIEKEGRLRLATPQLNGLGDAHIEEFNLLYVAITRSLERLEPHQELQKLLCSPLLNPNLPKPNLARYPSQNSQAQKTYDNELTEEKKSRKRQEWAEQIPFF
jgi:superfamily I DNA/RNA helicase